MAALCVHDRAEATYEAPGLCEQKREDGEPCSLSAFQNLLPPGQPSTDHASPPPGGHPGPLNSQDIQAIQSLWDITIVKTIGAMVEIQLTVN